MNATKSDVRRTLGPVLRPVQIHDQEYNKDVNLVDSVILATAKTRPKRNGARSRERMSSQELNPEPRQPTNSPSPSPAPSSNHGASSKGWRRLLQWRTFAIFLIIVGLVIVSLYGLRSLRSYHEFQYIRANGLDRGTARIEAIRGWMTVRYVGVAYAVPEEYIFAQLEIPYNRRNSNEILGRLNDEYQMGESPNGDYPQIIDRVAQAIEDYRANPLPTGLREIRPWMTIRYIANSTSVPEEYLLEKLGLDAQRAAEMDVAVRPLDQLPPELRFPGGPEALFKTLESAIAEYEGAQQ